MNKNHKPIFLFIICSLAFSLPSLACNWLSDPTERERTGQKILNQGIVETQSTMPYEDDKIVVKNMGYTGTIDIVTYSPCETTASAILTAYDDNTCQLSLSYERTYSLPDGTCNPAGWTEKWNIFGNLDEIAAICNLQYCNEPSYYSASGKVRFNSTNAWGDQTITCSSKSNEMTDITINGFMLNLSTP